MWSRIVALGAELYSSLQSARVLSFQPFAMFVLQESSTEVGGLQHPGSDCWLNEEWVGLVEVWNLRLEHELEVEDDGKNTACILPSCFSIVGSFDLTVFFKTWPKRCVFVRTFDPTVLVKAKL